MKQIDNNYLICTDQEAFMLNGGRLPLPMDGTKKLVMHRGQPHFLARTVYQGEHRWSIVPTAWRMKNGQMVLDMTGIEARDRYISSLQSEQRGIA